MGYYKCPRCGSTDAFEGTELNNGRKVSVIKCRDCGEILRKKKDYFLTEEEKRFEAEFEAQYARDKEAREKVDEDLVLKIFLIICVVVLLYILIF